MTSAVLVDLSGTLYVGNSPIPGAVEALEKLRRLPNVKLNFVTNTTKESERYLTERFAKLGFNIHGHEIFTSLLAAKTLIVQRNLKPLLLLEEAAMEDFRDLANYDEGQLNAVVIGLAPSKFDYNTMNKAFNMILNGATLIGIHKARYYQTENGLALGPGPFVSALEYATDRKAEVVGKPEASFFNEGLRRCCPDIDLLRRENSFMIGDDVRDDIGGAQRVGVKGILVKTGKYRPNDEQKIDPPPWRVVDSFTAAVDCIEKYLEQMAATK